MLYMMFFTLIPMLWGIAITFFRYSPTRQGGLLGFGVSNPFIGIDNYFDLFASTPNGQLFRLSVKNTLMFVLLYLPLNLIVTLPLAVLIESIAKGKYLSHDLLPASGHSQQQTAGGDLQSDLGLITGLAILD
jgi:ABC-type sugar transport system permease subunit